MSEENELVRREAIQNAHTQDLGRGHASCETCLVQRRRTYPSGVFVQSDDRRKLVAHAAAGYSRKTCAVFPPKAETDSPEQFSYDPIDDEDAELAPQERERI